MGSASSVVDHQYPRPSRVYVSFFEVDTSGAFDVSRPLPPEIRSVLLRRRASYGRVDGEFIESNGCYLERTSSTEENDTGTQKQMHQTMQDKRTAEFKDTNNEGDAKKVVSRALSTSTLDNSHVVAAQSQPFRRSTSLMGWRSR